jgi:hypothetical protein
MRRDVRGCVAWERDCLWRDKGGRGCELFTFPDMEGFALHSDAVLSQPARENGP